MLASVVGAVFGILHGVEGLVGLLPYAGPYLQAGLQFITG
jgi:hypothetical protein